MRKYEKCEKCKKKSLFNCNWCRWCQINDSEANFTSGNERIDDFIQGMISKINIITGDIVFEWIPYDQFNCIKEIGRDCFATTYLAIWKDGPLYYNEVTNNEEPVMLTIFRYKYEYDKNKWTRNPDDQVVLKYLNGSKNNVDEFLHKVEALTGKKNPNHKLYGLSQNPNTGDYIMVFNNEYYEEHCKMYCGSCGEKYTDVMYKWCNPCQANYIKNNSNWTSGNENIDNFIQEMQLKINNPFDMIFEWIPHGQFKYIKEIGRGGFATVYLAVWYDGPLHYDYNKMEWTRESNKQVALKCLNNSQNITNEFLNEAKAYSNNSLNIIRIYGISQNSDTKDYIMVLQYVKGGNFNNWMDENYKSLNWSNKIKVLNNIIDGLKEIHQQQMVHRDFHTGNILFKNTSIQKYNNKIYISDMGLCGEVDNIDKTKIYGVMPYIAPEVLRRKPYTQAADIYGFSMVMYFVATGRQPFFDRAHDNHLALDICRGIRPEINEQEAPQCYIDLMRKCWDSNLDNRPNAIEVYESIKLFRESFGSKLEKHAEIKKQFTKAEENRKENPMSIENYQSNTHSQAIYSSRLLNEFTNDLLMHLVEPN